MLVGFFLLLFWCLVFFFFSNLFHTAAEAYHLVWADITECSQTGQNHDVLPVFKTLENAWGKLKINVDILCHNSEKSERR